MLSALSIRNNMKVKTAKPQHTSSEDEIEELYDADKQYTLRSFLLYSGILFS